MRPSRRQFLRVSLLAAGSLGVPALGLWRLSAQDATPETGNSIELLGGDADVWAWQVEARGRVNGCDSISVNSVEASIDGDTFSVSVPISSGENLIRATCDHSNGQTAMSDSLTYTGKLQKRPRATIALSQRGDQIRLDGFRSQPAEPDGAPIATWVWNVRSDNPATIFIESPSPYGATKLDNTPVPQLTVHVPDTDGEYYLSLRVTDQEGLTDTSETYFVVRDGETVIPDYDTENTAWVENTVMYGVIPRNFGNPAFQAIIDRMDYLIDLGVNALWLSPINPTPPGDFGYAVVDYFNVNSDYGTNADFRRLVDEAHARGLRILMDFVPSHSSDQHPYFVDTVERGRDSRYWNFYARDENGNYTYYFYYENLPSLNFDNPEVRRWMLEIFVYWVREFDVDGFRVDMAWAIQERRPDFWPEWRNELKRIKPDLLLLAEAPAGDRVYFTNGFDAAYDWTTQVGHGAWETVFEDRNLLTYNLDAALTNRRGNGFDPDALIFRFLNNNDTGTRFASKYGPEMTRVATALLLTLPGIPCVYTGDEVGARFTPYGDPSPISWEEQIPGFHDYHKKLIHLRRETPSLHSRDWTILSVEPHQQVYGYLRYHDDRQKPLIVLLNFSDQAQDVTIEVPEAFPLLVYLNAFQDLITGEAFTPSSQSPLTINVPPMRALILR